MWLRVCVLTVLPGAWRENLDAALQAEEDAMFAEEERAAREKERRFGVDGATVTRFRRAHCLVIEAAGLGCPIRGFAKELLQFGRAGKSRVFHGCGCRRCRGKRKLRRPCFGTQCDSWHEHETSHGDGDQTNAYSLEAKTVLHRSSECSPTLVLCIQHGRCVFGWWPTSC